LNESEYIDPKYLTTRIDLEHLCISEALDYYGISVLIVLNYKDANLKMQTGKFYSALIIFGGGSGNG
jgi:hypothetical protein